MSTSLGQLKLLNDDNRYSTFLVYDKYNGTALALEFRFDRMDIFLMPNSLCFRSNTNFLCLNMVEHVDILSLDKNALYFDVYNRVNDVITQNYTVMAFK